MGITIPVGSFPNPQQRRRYAMLCYATTPLFFTSCLFYMKGQSQFRLQLNALSWLILQRNKN